MNDKTGRTRPAWVDWLALVGVAATIVIGATAGLLLWTRPDVVETTAVPTTPTTEGSSGTTVFVTSLPATTAPPATAPPATVPAAVPATATEQEFEDRWDSLPVVQRVNACSAVEDEGAPALAARMDAAAPGTVRVEFIIAVLNEKCSDASATPSATAPPVSLDIDWDAGKLDLRKQFCEQNYDVPVCVYSKNTDSWIPAGTG